jgi:hypothetical protein
MQGYEQISFSNSNLKLQKSSHFAEISNFVSWILNSEVSCPMALTGMAHKVHRVRSLKFRTYRNTFLIKVLIVDK